MADINPKLNMTQVDAQNLVTDEAKFSDAAKPCLDYLAEKRFSEIGKDEFVSTLEVLFESLDFKAMRVDYNTLWSSYELDYGDRSENMESPETLKKYLKDLTQEFIWNATA